VGQIAEYGRFVVRGMPGDFRVQINQFGALAAAGAVLDAGVRAVLGYGRLPGAGGMAGWRRPYRQDRGRAA
jgi:hypothetical protein